MKDNVKWPFEELADGEGTFGRNPHEYLEVIREHRYTFSTASQAQPDLTNRKLNHWEETGLITPPRKTASTGWRKFSFVGLVRLIIISKLKNFGLSTENVLGVLSIIDAPHPESESGDVVESWLEMEIVICLAGGDEGLLIEEGGSVTMSSIEELVDDYFNFRTGKNTFIAPRDDKPETKSFLLIFIAEIVSDLIKTLGKEINTDRKYYYILFDYNLRQVFNALTSRKYDEVIVTTNGGKHMKVTQRQRRSGKKSEEAIKRVLESGEFQKVELHHKGETLLVVGENKFKVERS